MLVKIRSDKIFSRLLTKNIIYLNKGLFKGGIVVDIDIILKEKRAEYQLTQEQLAEKIFVSKKTISNWETQKTTPDIDK